MPTVEKAGVKIWQKRDRSQTLLSWLGWLAGTAVVLYCAQIIAANTNWSFVADAPEQASNMISRGVPPNWAYLNTLWQALWDTLNIATLGTLLGVVIALPTAFLAARNTTPHPIVRYLALLVIVGSRSVNALIWALLLVVVLGPGVLAGILAIGLRSIGFTGKLFYEAIEEIDPQPVEAIAATGASAAQILSYGFWPQVMPSIFGVSFYRWDINIRESTVVGLVGAGGIGIQLQASINILRWSQVSSILLVVFLAVFVSEWISATVRRLLI
ncbi:MAG: phosphonate ABC transporter, permease protein PhnE [Phormidesmis sp.]